MARFRLSANEAQKTGWGGITIRMHLGSDNPFPSEYVEATKTADVLAALDAYAKRAEATGKSLACSAYLPTNGGRAPSGWRTLTNNDLTRFVNLA